MTFADKLRQEHPEKVGRMYVGGFGGCPFKYGYEKSKPDFCIPGQACPNRCAECWDREIPGNEAKLEDNHALPLDIHKLIDLCILKKDRYVVIFVSDKGTTVNIYPLADDEDE